MPYHGSRLLSFLVACYHFSEYLGHLPWLGGSCKRYLRWITDYTPSLGRTIITTYKHTTRITSERTREHLKIFPPSFPFLFFFFHARFVAYYRYWANRGRIKRRKGRGIWESGIKRREGENEKAITSKASTRAKERERESDGGERRERRAILSERLCPRTRFSNRSNLQSANRRRRQPSNKSNSRRNGEGGSGEEKREAAAAALRGEW